MRSSRHWFNQFQFECNEWVLNMVLMDWNIYRRVITVICIGQLYAFRCVHSITATHYCAFMKFAPLWFTHLRRITSKFNVLILIWISKKIRLDHGICISPVNYFHVFCWKIFILVLNPKFENKKFLNFIAFNESLWKLYASYILFISFLYTIFESFCSLTW